MMSKTVTTQDGVFHYVQDGEEHRWLFACPICDEMLPVGDAELGGIAPITHESRKYSASFCKFGGFKLLGPSLIAKMQARRLMEDYGVFDDQVKP